MIKNIFKTNTLPTSVTSYDVLKTVAVLLMIIDHVGGYFFPEQFWIRVAGRMCVPMWFFLIGYARTRDIPFTMWAGALILLFANFMVGLSIFAANVLVSMIIIRLVIDYVAPYVLKNVFSLVVVSFILVALAVPTMYLTEYGSVGLMFALCGYFLRHKEEVQQKGWNKDFAFNFVIFSAIVFAIQQQLDFNFSVNQFAVMAGGSVAVGMALMKFKPMEFKEFTQKTPTFAVAFLHLFGRRTLEIYVLHLVLFKSLALYLGYDYLEFMQFMWFKEGLLDFE